MKRVSKCRLCTSDKRQSVESDLKAGLTYREIAERHELDKMLIYRHHTRHMRGPEFPEDAAHDLKAALSAAYGALARAQRRNDIRAMTASVELVQTLLKLQNAGSVTAAPDGGDGLSSVSDFHLAERRKEYLRVRRQGETDDDLRQEIADIQAILDSRAAQLAEESQAEDSGSDQ